MDTQRLGDVARAPFSVFSGGQSEVTAVSAPGAQAALDANMQDGTQSPLIEGLLNRKSVLGTGPYAQVSDAVLAANSRAAEADLRAAMLRSEAEATNWLPTLGPNISLTSLGDVVTQLVVEQVLFDNGRKQAERDYAQADVEVAAVALAQDTNDRVMTALDLYLKAQEAEAQAAVNAKAMEQMNHFAYVMEERVKGGVSNRADLNVVLQKRNQMQADLAQDRGTAETAMAELNAMAATPLNGVSGLSAVGDFGPGDQPLTVMKAEAEAERAIAESIAVRAGFLPQLTATGVGGSEGSSGSLNVGAAQGLGLGTGASLEALEAQREGAAARVSQVQEDAGRTLEGMKANLAALKEQEAQAAVLAEDAARNYDVYADQQRSGHRSVPDVVGIFETKVRTEREATTLRYDIARAELRIAALMGALVNGDRI
ncbi:MAG: TolC family protein [Pseudomonadota bacterium]